MNCKELFDLYESYLGIYDDSEELIAEKRFSDKKPLLKHYDINDDDEYPEAVEAGGKIGRLNTSLTNPDTSPAPKRKSSANRILKKLPFHSSHLKPAPRREPSANSIRRFQRNDVEYVLDYLIDEGFTDSYESAIEIVESMSDEWFDSIIEGWLRKDPWEVTLQGHDNNSPAGIAVGRAMNTANRGGVRDLKPSTAANMERQARNLERRNAEGHNKAKAIRAVARYLTKQQRIKEEPIGSLIVKS